jgi:hypothetical protein
MMDNGILERRRLLQLLALGSRQRVWTPHAATAVRRRQQRQAWQ